MAKRKARTIEVGELARVEGEGALRIRYPGGGKPAEVELRIFEPPRLFEAILRGRDRGEAPDITARICGICPVAYQMSACHAIEAAAGVTIDGPLRELRRLLYCGEWIESHALHVFMLHAPDFLGYEDVVGMAADHGELVRKALRMKKAGNAIVARLGGREIHPINVRVGGFHRAPSRAELTEMREELVWAEAFARETVRWTGGLVFPDLERDVELVALSHPDEYAMNEGRLVSSAGLAIDAHEFEEHVVEEQVERSTALHARLRDRGTYQVGPLARINLSFDRLPEAVRDAAREAGLTPPCRNPFRSITARAVELLYAFGEALRIIDAYEPPELPFVELPRTAGRGCSITEAPRGILYHRYDVADDGSIAAATIVPPTSQNQRSIEEDLVELAPGLLDLDHDAATRRAEQAVRNYDPCISCSTHFLTLERVRADGGNDGEPGDDGPRHAGDR